MRPLPGYYGDTTTIAIAAFTVLPGERGHVALPAEGPYVPEIAHPRPITAVPIVAGD